MSGWRVVVDFGGLSETVDGLTFPLAERLDFFDLVPARRSVPLALALREIDIPALVAAGYDPDEALVRVYDPDGTLVLAGRAEDPRWGQAGEPLRLTVAEDPWADGSKIPAPWSQRVTVIDSAVAAAVQSAPLVGIPLRAWGYYEPEDLRGSPRSPPVVGALGYGSLFADKVTGRAGPIVFGAPGYQDGESWGATPAYWIDVTEGAEVLQIARHRVEATTCTVYGPCYDGEVRGKVASVSHTTDLQGVEIAVAEIDSLLGRAPILTLTLKADNTTTYDLGGRIGSRGEAGAVSDQPWSISVTPVASTFASIVSAINAALDASPNNWGEYVTVETVETDPDEGVHTIRFRGAYVLTVTTQTATGGAGTIAAAVTYAGGGSAPFPTDFTPDLDADWSVAWTGGEGLSGGLGDVIRYVLDQTTIRVDRAHLDSFRRVLNGYRLAGYIDEEVDAAEWLARQLRPLPISWVSGRDGLRVWLYDPTAAAVATLDEAAGFEIEGDAGLTAEEPVRSVELRYRHREDGGGSSLSTGYQETLHGRTSAGRVEVLETDLIDATTTAEAIATLRQRLLARRHLVVRGLLRRADWSWLRAGDPVDVAAWSRGVGGPGVVVEVEDDAGGWLRVEVVVWRDRALRVETAPVDVVPEYTPPEPPAYPASVIANWTLYTGRIYDGPVDTAAIVNRSGVATVEDLVPTGKTDLSGYAPDGETTVASLTSLQKYEAFLHDLVAESPDPPTSGPYRTDSPSYVVAKQPLYSDRDNNEDLLAVYFGGQGTGTNVTSIAGPWAFLETGSSHQIGLRVYTGASPTSIATWTGIDERVHDGTGSVDSWICAGIWWDGTGGWRVRVVADFDDGLGQVVLIDDDTATGGTYDAEDPRSITYVRAQGPQVFGSYCFGQGPEADMLQAMTASIYEVEDL